MEDDQSHVKLRAEQEIQFSNPIYEDRKKHRFKNGNQFDFELLPDTVKHKNTTRRQKKCCYACIIIVLILILATCIAALVTLTLHAHQSDREAAGDSDESLEVNAVIYIVNYNHSQKYNDLLSEKSKQLTSDIAEQFDEMLIPTKIGDELSHITPNEIRKGSIIFDLTLFFNKVYPLSDLESTVKNAFQNSLRATNQFKTYMGKFEVDIHQTIFKAVKWSGGSTSSTKEMVTSTTTTMTTKPPVTCEPINNRLCHSDRISYSHTSFPNYLGQQNQSEINAILHQLHMFLMGGCYPHGQRFVCSVVVPKCENSAVVPPCREMCSDFYQKCRSSVPEVFQSIDCSIFPEEKSGDCISAPPIPDMNIRLKSSSPDVRPMSGVVEAEMFTDHWIAVCGHGWSDIDGDVICKQLNFSNVKKTETKIDHSGIMTFIYGVNCLGNEDNFGQCELMMSSDVPMPCDNVAMVECENQATDIGGIKLRLAGGTSTEGRLEIYHQGVWGTVCDDLFGDKEAAVVCGMLGFSRKGAIVLNNSVYKESDLDDILLDDVVCNGNETNIGLCKHSGWGRTNCIHKEDVVIKCISQMGPSPNESEKPIILKTTQSTTPKPEIVEMRLEGGKPFQSGRIEVQLTGSDTWGTVCRSLFNDVSAKVFCKMMGYQDGVYEMARYGAGTGPIVMNYVHCQGTENTISECNYDVDTHGCTHIDDVSISCHNNF